MLGPWYVEGVPELALGADIANGAEGEPTFYSGHLLTLDGEPIAGGVLDVWSGDGAGFYDMQMPDQSEPLCRGKFRTDALGRRWFRSIRPTDRVKEFFFAGSPLNITGGTGSPINPLAIK